MSPRCSYLCPSRAGFALAPSSPGMRGQVLQYRCTQFNSPYQNGQVCIVLLLEAQILVFRGYQDLTFPVGKCCLHSGWNISVVKLLVQNTSLTEVKTSAICRADFQMDLFLSLIKNIDCSKGSSITDRHSAIISWLAAPVWHWVPYIKCIICMETAPHSACTLKVNSGFSNNA